MNKGLKREDARACPVHTQIYQEAVKRLQRDTEFSIREVLEVTRMMAMADSIRWDYIVDFIRMDYNLQALCPLSEAYYKPHLKEDEYRSPGTYVAYGGATGKAVGYAMVTERNRHLVIARLKQRQHILDGTIEKHQGYVDEARTRFNLGASWTPLIGEEDDEVA